MGTTNDASAKVPADVTAGPAHQAPLPSPVEESLPDLDLSVELVAAAAPPPPPPTAGPAPAAGLRKAVVSGAAWLMTGFVVLQVLRFFCNILLARLLAPDIFGLMALVYTFIQGLHMFSDVGIGPSIIQSKRGEDPVFLNTAWTVQILRGFGLWLCAILIGWPVAQFYGDPLLVWLIPIVGVNEAISGFDSTALNTLRRHLARGRLMVLEIGMYGLSQTVTIAWVLLIGPSIWALVAGSIVTSSANALCSHFLIPGYRNRPRWDRDSLHELTHFAKWIFVSTLFMFLAAQADRLMVGKLGVRQLGVYYFAVMLSLMPVQLLSTLSWQLVFPLYSRLHQAGRDIVAIFRRVHPAAAGLGALLVAGLIATGPTLVRFLYDTRYYGAGWMVQLLAVGAWFQILEGAGGAVLWATGHARAPAISNAAKVVTLVVLAPLGYTAWGLPGMIAGFVAGDLVRYVSTVSAVRRRGIAVLRFDLLWSAFIAAAGLAGIAAGDLLWPYPVRGEYVALLAGSPDAGFPASLPWGALPLCYRKDWHSTVGRLVVQGGTVILLWSAAMLVAWWQGLFQRESPG